MGSNPPGHGRTEGAVAGDFDLSGDVNGVDIQLFVYSSLASSWSAGILCAGDFNHDLVLSVEDIQGMIDALLDQ